MKIAHYLNQFFAGLGGEEAARTPPRRIDGAVGPGRALGLEIAFTLVCGDDYFAEHEDEALTELLRSLAEDRPSVLVLGPSFGSGRYGYACGTLAREAARLGLPTVCGMFPENPGVMAAEGAAYIVPTKQNVAGMREALPQIAALADRLGRGETIGPPEADGYLPRGIRQNHVVERTGAERALDLLLAKLAGEVRTEAPRVPERVPPPPPVHSVADVTLALVTEAGCVPQGNPDGIPTIRSNKWLRYPVPRDLAAGAYEFVHGGYDVSAGNADPDRLVPLDVIRVLQAEGRVGRLHEWFYTTTGNGTTVAAATRFGQEIAQALQEGKVGAALLSGT